MFEHCKYDDLKDKGAKYRSTRLPVAHSWWLQINQRKQVVFHISGPHCWKLSRWLVFILAHSRFFWEQRCYQSLPCLLCMLCCCMYTCALMTSLYAVSIWRIKYEDSSGDSKFSLSSKAGDGVIFACFVQNPLHVLAQPKCRLSFPRVPKHWLTLPPPFFLQNTPISRVQRESNVN